MRWPTLQALFVNVQTAALGIEPQHRIHPRARKRPCRCCASRADFERAVAMLVGGLVKRGMVQV